MTLGVRISEFDTWRVGYAGGSVQVLIAGGSSLASIFSDAALTVPLANPQTLLTMTDTNGETSGKWAQPVYIGVAYTLLINATEQTGVERVPIFDVADLDISEAQGTSTRGTYLRALEDFMDRDVEATLYGSLLQSDGAATCTATLNLAIGAAAAQGGGRVLLPPGTIPFHALSLPEGVILEGKGEGVTTLQSTDTATPTVTLAGDGSGLSRLTLDGVNLSPQSIGVQGIGIAQPVFSEVLIKRFVIGMRFRGILAAVWRNLSISNCTTGAAIRGDGDAALSNTGTHVENIQWIYGEISLCTASGLSLLFFDKNLRDCVFSGLSIVSNTGTGVVLQGARGIEFHSCQWASNVANLSVLDGTDVTYKAINTVERIRVIGGTMLNGTCTFQDTCDDVQFSGVSLLDISIVLTAPLNTILLVDCIEDAGTTSTGSISKLLRRTSVTDGVVHGVTTDATPLAAWERSMDPGEVLLIEAKAVARRRDGITYGIFWVACGVIRPAATLPFQVATGAFTIGLVLTGHTSGASARIVTVTQSGANGTLALRDIVGTFLNGETISDTNTGSGQFVGVMGFSNSALDSGGVGAIRTLETTGSSWAVDVAVLNALVQVRVAGEASAIVEWTVEVSVTEP